MKRLLAFFRAADLPFGKDDANRFLPWIIAFMVFSTGIILAGWLSINGMISGSRNTQMNAFTVHLESTSENATGNAQKIVALLQQTDGIASAAIVSNAEIKKWVKPWLGDAESIDMLPLPVMIEARMDDPSAVSFEKLSVAVRGIAPDAKLDSHSAWMVQFTNALWRLQAIAASLALLFLSMMALIITFTAKTSVKLHQQAVTILHSVGALDAYIARQFQVNAGWLSLKGAGIGALASALLYALVGWVTSTANSALLPHFSVTMTHIAMFATLPLLAAVIAMLATRFTVLAQLRKMP